MAGLFAAVAGLWGVPFALIKVALEHTAEPLLIAWTRVAIGAVILLAVAAGRGRLRGWREHLGMLTLIAVCDVAAPFTLLTLAERDVSSSLAGVLAGLLLILTGSWLAGR